MYLGLRVLVGVLWTAALTLMMAASLSPVAERQLHLYSWSMFLCFAAMPPSAWVIVEHLAERESRYNAQLTADAVGEAVARALADDRDDNDDGPIPITRRGI